MDAFPYIRINVGDILSDDGQGDVGDDGDDIIVRWLVMIPSDWGVPLMVRLHIYTYSLPLLIANITIDNNCWIYNPW